MRRNDREVTEIKEIEDIIKKCKVCHVAMVDDGMPYVVPLNFGYEFTGNNLTLYFHSAKKGRKLDIWQKNNKVCFEMANEGEPVHADTPCNSGYYFSSLIGNGCIEFISDVQEKCKALSLLMKHQADQEVVFNQAQAESVCVYKVSTSDFIGKKKPRPQE